MVLRKAVIGDFPAVTQRLARKLKTHQDAKVVMTMS